MVDFSALSTPYAVPVDASRPSDSATAAVRITPLVQGDGPQSDSRGRSYADRAAESRFNGRVAFTAKFGPDPETGLPLQVVRGEDVEAAENFDLFAVIDRRIAHRLADGSVLGVQEARDRALPSVDEADDGANTETVDAPESVGVSREDLEGPENAASVPAPDFGFSRPAPSAERGAVLDLSI